jgi:hypothetical protein
MLAHCKRCGKEVDTADPGVYVSHLSYVTERGGEVVEQRDYDGKNAKVYCSEECYRDRKSKRGKTYRTQPAKAHSGSPQRGRITPDFGGRQVARR